MATSPRRFRWVMQLRTRARIHQPHFTNLFQTLNDLFRFLQLSINAGRERCRRIFENDIRLYSLALYTVAIPGIPTCCWNPQPISVEEFEVRAA